MKTRPGPYLPQIVFALALVLGAGMTFAVHRSAEQRAAARFERDADLAVHRVLTRLRQHVVVLHAAQGLFAASDGAVSRAAFARFLAAFDPQQELSGVQGIGFARMIPASQTAQAEAEIRRHYGHAAPIRPATTEQTWRAPITLLEPQDHRNSAALGFDMFADPARRLTMERALSSGEARMTGPLELVQEITADKQTGFLIYLPYGANTDPGSAPVAGFVYAPFRGKDLFRAALAHGPDLAVALRVTDTGAVGKVLFDGLPPEDRTAPHLTRITEVMGRQWVFQIHDTDRTPLLWRHFGALLMGLASGLFALATGFAMAARQHETAQAHALAEAAAREAEYRGLLIDEMKHRIKNHIARIQSIARQSARSATDLRSFADSFDARLQAMAAAQEVLAGTSVPQADLATILRKELQQGLDRAEVDHLIDGPTVRLDERQAHAFALIAHELVTNAMKYGGLSAQGSGLRIGWQILPGAELALDWIETAPPAPATPISGRGGFGSRLIEASLRGELSGRMDRAFTETGLTIHLRFPLNPALQTTKAGV